MSASSRTKHIHHRFYLVKDKQDWGELEVRYEPTERMWSDILTKPKQGKAYHEFRQGYYLLRMNWTPLRDTMTKLYLRRLYLGC